MMISEEMVDKYKRGSRPEGNIDQNEVGQIKQLLLTTINKTQQDFAAGIFEKYSAFTTMSGFELKDAETANEFNNYHEGVHTGVMMSLRKFI